MNKEIKSSSRSATWLDEVRNWVVGLRYGTVQITVHDGRVVQIDRTEKTRIVPPDIKAGERE